jgi:transposase InsO family protein
MVPPAAISASLAAFLIVFPWDEAPHYLIGDRDRIYSRIVTRRLRAMGIRDKLTAPASPWQNGFAERQIGSIRRECLDHIIVSGEAHLRGIRTHTSILGEGCTGLARRRSRRAHSLSPNPGRAASPICPDLIYDRHRHLLANVRLRGTTILTP